MLASAVLLASVEDWKFEEKALAFFLGLRAIYGTPNIELGRCSFRDATLCSDWLNLSPHETLPLQTDRSEHLSTARHRHGVSRYDDVTIYIVALFVHNNHLHSDH